MKVVTWNVNSVKARHDRLLAFLEREAPDVLCLQELKGTDETFPFDDVAHAGYRAAVHGQKTYNGVAILSRGEPQDVVRGMQDDVDDPQARLIEARVDDVRVICGYFPNGKAVGTDKYEYKLAWMERLHRRIEQTARPDDHLILCGDMNVAPAARDVAFPDQWEGSVLTHDEVRGAFQQLVDWGFEDVYRTVHPDGEAHSWWDYRMLAFPKGNGLRIDHILATPSLARRASACYVDRDERKGTRPSDHAPVIAVFDPD